MTLDEQITTYRTRLFTAIRHALAADGGGKSYEGQIQIHFPGVHYEGAHHAWEITVDCYILGPARHYSYVGNDLDECFAKANADLDQWIENYNAETPEDPIPLPVTIGVLTFVPGVWYSVTEYDPPTDTRLEVKGAYFKDGKEIVQSTFFSSVMGDWMSTGDPTHWRIPPTP